MIDAACDPAAPAPLMAGVHTMVFHEPGGRARSEQAHPAWTILLPAGGHIDWWIGRSPGRRAAGVVFPPHVECRVGSFTGHLTILIDPWFQDLGPGRRAAVPLDSPAVEHLRALWSRVEVVDIDQTAQDTVAYLRQQGVLPPAATIDPRVVAALGELSAVQRVEQLAVGVGLSPSRLRALIHDLTGMSPRQVRMWQRLRAAMRTLPHTPIAVAAADAGFADQAHLTRTASRLVGRTPAELARMQRRTARAQA